MFNKPLRMTKKDERSFKEFEGCHICGKEYSERDIRVRDHCHITGKYRGSAHQDCYINFQLTDKIPVMFHNLRGYDSHFIMQQIGEISKTYTYKDKKDKDRQMDNNVIPNGMEKYMAFMLGKNLVFIDSFQFMSSSSERLVSNLPNEAFKHTREEVGVVKTMVMKRKGIYPYDFMDCFEKFNRVEHPTREEFYSILTDGHVKDEDYENPKDVWSIFGIENMGEYLDLYLKSDISCLLMSLRISGRLVWSTKN